MTSAVPIPKEIVISLVNAKAISAVIIAELNLYEIVFSMLLLGVSGMFFIMW